MTHLITRFQNSIFSDSRRPLVAAELFAAGCTGLGMLIIARTLGAAGYGAFAVGLSISTIAVTLCELRASQAALPRITAHLTDTPGTSFVPLATSRTAIVLASFGADAAAALLAASLASLVTLMLHIAAPLPVLSTTIATALIASRGMTFGTQTVNIARRRIGLMASLRIIGSALRLALLAVGALTKLGPDAFLLLFGIATLSEALLSVCATLVVESSEARTYARSLRWDDFLNGWRAIQGDTLRLGAASLAGAFSTQGDVLIGSFAFTPGAIGAYKFGKDIASALSNIVLPVQSAALYELSGAGHSTPDSETIAGVRKFGRPSATVCVAVAAIMPILLPTLGGTEYRHGVPAGIILALGISVHAIYCWAKPLAITSGYVGLWGKSIGVGAAVGLAGYLLACSLQMLTVLAFASVISTQVFGHAVPAFLLLRRSKHHLGTSSARLSRE